MKLRKDGHIHEGVPTIKTKSHAAPRYWVCQHNAITKMTQLPPMLFTSDEAFALRPDRVQPEPLVTGGIQAYYAAEVTPTAHQAFRKPALITLMAHGARCI